MDLKKFNSLSQFLLSKEFRKKDLSYCDLSGIDLSKMPISTWDNFVFDHTNFTDTGIKFYPEKLRLYYQKFKSQPFSSIEYCNFTNCDLSYLDSSDIASTSIKGCNFTNTKLDVELYNGFGYDLKYDWEGLGNKDYSDIIFPQNERMYETINKIGFLVNYQTIINNPFIPFSSKDIYSAIHKQLPDIYSYITSKKMVEINSFIDEMLKEDEKREGKLLELINLLDTNNPFSDFERIRFFQNGVTNKKFSSIDFSNIPLELFDVIRFNECYFENIIFPEHLEDNFIIFSNSSTPYIYIPTITPSSWTTLDKNRLGISRITFYRNLYLELGRACNGKCKFCRNQYLEPCRYDLKGIKNSLSQIGDHLDNIVVGGGEPTLLPEDIKFLMDSLTGNHIRVNWTIFTNASTNLENLIELGENFNFNISRHAVSDQLNNKILGVNSLNTMELQQLKKEVYNNITLCATCFKGDGLDSVEKLEDYLSFADDCDINSLLFQTLHKDLNDVGEVENVLPIEDEIFDEMIIKLQEQGYDMGIPIYSTGDYKLIIVKNGVRSISFKKYITEEELEREWYRACKRTFDLSMDPSGNIYQNWHQSSGKVLLKQL